MKITIVENKEHGFANLKFSDKPDYVKDKALLDELKANGWGYSKYNGVWYPRTNEAKNKANDFAKEIVEKYSEPAKSFGQELFERSQRIDEWKKNNLNVEENPVQSTSQDHSTNEPVSQPVQNIELNDKQKQVLDLLKSAGNLSESKMLEIVSKIDQAYQSKNFEPAQKRIPKELSWEELKEFIHADDSFDLSKDLRELYHPKESETYQKIMATYNHFHDIMNWDVLRETAYERSADSEFHNSMESIRKNILWDTCEKTVNGFFNTFEDFQNYFKTLRDNEIYNISKNYMENPEIKAMYKEMKKAELSERVPDILKGREFSSWLIPNPEQDGAFLFYESNGYLKSEYLNQNKYESVKKFLEEVESEELLIDSAKQLKTEYAKMHGLLKTTAEEIKEDIEADKLDDLMTELVEEELYQNNQQEAQEIEANISSVNVPAPTNENTEEEKSIELTEEDLEYAQKVIPEEQYMDMLQYANGEEAEHFKAKLKNAANIAREMINRKSSKELVNADGSHPCKLHYFIGGCDWYISELDKDGVGFGYAILNNDLTFSEWGSVNVCGDSKYEQPLTKMSVSVPVEINGREFRNSLTPQLDLYLDEDTTIERELYKRDNEFFNEYEKYAKIEKNNEKELAKSSEVSINIIEETNQDLEAQYGSEINNGLVGRADSSSGSNITQELEGQGESRNWGDNSREGQRVLSGEREGNSELGHTERVPGIEQSRPESWLNNIPSKEGLSGSNETLYSESSIAESNANMQSAGLADNSNVHRSSTKQSQLGVGIRTEGLNENKSISDDPLQGTSDIDKSDELIEIEPVEWSALSSLAENSECNWWIEKYKNPETYNILSKQDIINIVASSNPLIGWVGQSEFNTINELLERIENTLDITKEADIYFDEITKSYSEDYAEFFQNYNEIKESHLENETRYIGDARIRSLFENTHRKLVNLQFEELTNIIKNARNLEIAKKAATRYFNFAGQDEFNYLHDNLFLRCNLGDYVRNELGTTSFVAPKPEELQDFITEAFNRENTNSLFGKSQETSKPVFNFFVKDTAEFEQFEDFEPITNLNADEAINEYIKKYNEGLFACIGINMPGDLVFDDPNGEGAYILLRKENVDTFKIMGDTFITQLKEADERSEKYIKAYEELYDAALAHGLNVERPDFLFKKTYELYHKPSLEFDFDVDDLFENTPIDDKEYAENLADWIIQHGMNESTEMENYSVSFEDILDNTDTTEEWLNAHIDLVNDALAAHNDNELLEYNPDENEGKEFNLYFCSNSDEMGENTLFKQNKEGRWIRKSEEELQKEKLEINNSPKPDNPQHTLSWEERPVEQLTSKKDIKAIREQCREILKKPDSEITEADKAILAQYEGAGGIKEENRTAAGVLNEFYTPNNLVEKVWQIVDAYAPEAKTVLEPSAGVGKFANNRPNNEFTMHELDETSARINKILHPEANIIQGAYQKQFFDAGGRIHMPGQKEHYDVVIGNPPYGLYNDKYKGLGEGKEFDRYEEYFISKGLDALKDENSIMAFVVPSGFLNNASDKQKKIIASKGKLIDAYRLPVGTFPTTDVGTDIIIMTSWEKDRNEIDLKNQLVGVKAHAQLTNERLKKRQENYLNTLSSGEWFKQHPEKILGEVKTRTNRFGKIEEYVAVHEGLTVQDELNKIDSMIPKKNYELLSSEQLELMGNEKISQTNIQKESASVQPEQTQSVSDQSETVAEEIDDPSKRLYEDPDGVFKTNHKLTRQEFAQFYTGANFTSEDYNIWGATDWKGIVDLSKLTAAEQNFLKTSENYVEIADGVYTNAMLYATGNIYEKLDALEEEKENLSEASYNRAKQILENAIPKIVPIEQIKMDALSPLADEFKVSREVTSSYWNLGSSQLNTSVQSINLREDFINWATNCSSLDNFDEKNQPVNTRRAIYNYSTTKIAREDIPEDISWTDIVNYIDKIPVPTHINEKEDTKEVKNKKNLIAGNIKDARKNTCYTLFNRYLQEGLPQEDKERLQTTWNKIYNATVHADYKKLPLFIEGMNTFKGNNPFMLYKQQVEGVSRLLSKGNGLLAYEVGVGKTAAGIVTTMGQLQLGRCKRPLIIVPNQVYKKWVNDFRQLFPDVKINELYNLSEKYISHNYDEKTHSLVIEPNTVTVITDSALQKITFSDKACQTELAEDFGYLLGLSEAINSGDDKIRAEAYQKIMKEVGQASRIQVKKLPEGREQEIQQSYIFFDECGFDNVVIDEAHRYKNLFTVPRPKRGEKTSNEFQGLGTGKPSIRAEKVFGITTLIQRHNEDRNVFLLTATPFTNNPLEVYSMLSYMGRKELINRHIYDVRDFCTEFAQTKFEYAVKPSGDIEPKQVMKNFRGQKKLKNLVFEYIDPVTAEEAGIARPEGARHPIYLELSPLQDRIIKLEQETITKSDNPYVMLKAMTTMRTCTLSPALLDPDDFAGVEDIVIPPKNQIVESSPKLSWVCNTCADLYKQKPECGQFIYMPQGKDCFDEVKEYLIRQGIPEEAIDYIHSTHNGSAEDKDKISARFNDVNDKLKILIGTATVAEGIDLNGNSIVEYNTMLGWNPTESIQVEGRIWRQGNLQGKVHIMYPLMENSIDALIYQKHDEKAHRINSVLSKSDDGNDVIDTDEINPETIKFDLITDPTKKVKMIINEKTAGKRKEMKVIDNRIETLQELENDRQNSKSIYDLNIAEKEKYKTLLKTCREELKNDPENWQKQARVEANERNVEVCNKEIAKAKNRLSTISYNFNKFDIHDPEREVPIKLQELVTKKAELEADVEDIVNSEARLVAEEQKKLLEKKMLSKPVEQLRKEWVELVLKDTWYKETTDKSKDSSKTVQKPLEAVKDFKIPDVMLKNLDKAIAEKDFKVLEDYLCWGDRTTINDMNENDKAIEIMRKRYEKATGIQLPQDIHKTIDYLVSVCDEKTLPKNCQFKSMEEAAEYVASGLHGEAYQRDGYVEYVTLDNFKKNRNVAELAKGLIKNEGQGWTGMGSAEFGFNCNPKRVQIKAFINKKREEFFVSWNDIAKLKAKQWNKEYPLDSTIKVDEEEMKKISTAKVEQLDLFGFEELKQQARTLDVRYGNTVDSVDLLKSDSLKKYKGLPPFFKKSDDEWVIRCKGKDFAITNNFYKDDIVDVSITKQQLRTMVKAHLDNEAKIIQHMKFDNPGFDGKVKTPKPEVGEVQKALLMENGISELDVKVETKKMFNELLCDGENPILKKKEKPLPQRKQTPIQNTSKLLPGNQSKAPVQVEIIETDFDYEY